MLLHLNSPLPNCFILFFYFDNGKAAISPNHKEKRFSEEWKLELARALEYLKSGSTDAVVTELLVVYTG